VQSFVSAAVAVVSEQRPGREFHPVVASKSSDREKVYFLAAGCALESAKEAFPERSDVGGLFAKAGAGVVVQEAQN